MIFYFFSALGAVFLLLAFYGIHQRNGAVQPGLELEPAHYPTAVVVTLFGLGLLLLLAAVPGALFGQPHWLVDKFYGAIGAILG